MRRYTIRSVQRIPHTYRDEHTPRDALLVVGSASDIHEETDRLCLDPSILTIRGYADPDPGSEAWAEYIVTYCTDHAVELVLLGRRARWSEGLIVPLTDGEVFTL